MDRHERPDQHDRRIAAVLGELAELGRRIGERAGELARLTAERRRSTPTVPYRSDGTASVAAAAADLAAETARVVSAREGAAPAGRPRGGPARSPSIDVRASRRRIAVPRRPVVRAVTPRSRRRFTGPIVVSAIVHGVALVALSAMFIAVEGPKSPVALTLSLSEAGEVAEAGLDELALAEFDAPDAAEEAVPAEDAPQPEPIDVPLEELLAADAPVASEPAEPLEQTHDALDAAPLADAAEASGALPVDGGALVAAIDGGIAKGGGGAVRGAAPGGKPAATFFGRSGQGKSVCFLCDNSNSYRDGGFHRVLEEIARAIDGLGPGQSFSVIFFSDTAYPLFHPEPAQGLVPATPENKRRARQWLGTVEMCRGGQGIHDAVRLAAGLDADAVYLLSDGELGAGVVDKVATADLDGTVVHTFGLQQNVFDRRRGGVDPDRLRDQQARNDNLLSIAAAHRGTFTPVTLPPGAAALERLRPIPRNRSRGAVWGLKL